MSTLAPAVVYTDTNNYKPDDIARPEITRAKELAREAGAMLAKAEAGFWFSRGRLEREPVEQVAEAIRLLALAQGELAGYVGTVPR